MCPFCSFLLWIFCSLKGVSRKDPASFEWIFFFFFGRDGVRCVTLLTLGLCVWEMCQSPAQSCDWLGGLTPPSAQPLLSPQKPQSSQTLGLGLHSNCHFRNGASCKCLPPCPFYPPPTTHTHTPPAMDSCHHHVILRVLFSPHSILFSFFFWADPLDVGV